MAVLAIAAPSAQAQQAALPVEVAKVKPADVPISLQGIGTVKAFNTVTLHAQVDGVLERIRFTEGQAVRAGDVLAQIDPRPYEAALEQARAKMAQDEAQLGNAQLDLQRYTNLARTAFASRQQLATQQALVAQLQAQMQGDQAAIKNAQAQLSYTTLTSPIDGITGIRLVDQGNLVRASDATGIVVITQIQPISVVFTLPAENVGEIRHAMTAGPLQVTVLERPSGQPLGLGTLLLVNNQIDATTGQVQLKATLPNQDGVLWPNQFITAQLRLRVDHDVPTVPSGAVQRGPDGY
jgi:multidrug efflux system membrane fusion protein